MTEPTATPPSPFSAELEQLHTAARADLDAAATSDPTDYPAWCRRVAAARRTLSNIYRLAASDVPAHSLTWHAFQDAMRLCDSHVIRLLAEATNNPKGR